MARAAVKATPTRPRKAAPASRGYGEPGRARHDPAKHPRGPDGRFITSGGAGAAGTTTRPKAARTAKAAKPAAPPRKVGTPKQRKGLADQIRAARAKATTPEARRALLTQVRDLRAKRAEWRRGQGKTQVEALPKPPKVAKEKAPPKIKKAAEPKTKKEKTPKAPKEKAPAKESRPVEVAAPGAHGTLEGARAWAEAHGVNVVPGSPVTLEHLNAVNREVAKMPAAMVDAVKAAGNRMDILVGRGITDHPSWSYLKGVTPRGWPAGKTWDNVPGAASGDKGATVIVANRLDEGHGSANLVLHEHAHTFDDSLVKLKGARGSDSPEWRQVHGSAEWSSAYQKDYPEEGYAESFAKYYDGKASRSSLPKPVLDYWARQFS